MTLGRPRTGIRPSASVLWKISWGERTANDQRGGLLKLLAADHNRALNESTGLSGKVHAGGEGCQRALRHRFDGNTREAALDAWPRESLDAIRLKFEEVKLRVALSLIAIARVADAKCLARKRESIRLDVLLRRWP